MKSPDRAENIHKLATKFLRLVSLLMIATTAACQEPDLAEKSLEELMSITVSTASKREQAASEAPASVTVITADEIRKYGYRTLADALRSVRSFYVGYDRNYSYASIRGFSWPGDYSTRILLLVDGHRLNDNIYDQGMIGTEFPVDVDLIQRIEVIRGPASSLYGSNAFFAVINVMTRRGRSLKGLETSFSAASFGTYQGRVSYGNKFKDVELMISGSVYDSRGQDLFFPEYNSAETNHGWAVRADDDQFSGWLATVSWRAFTLQGLYSLREKGVPTAPYGTVFTDRRTRTTDGRRYVDVAYERTFSGEWVFSARAFYDQQRYDGSYPALTDLLGPPMLILDTDYSRGEWWGTEARVSRRFAKRHRITVGGEFRDNLRQRIGNYVGDPYFQFYTAEKSSLVWAGYLQDEFTISSKLTLNAGLRYDRYERFGGTVNPRAGLIFRPRERTTIKLLYGSAFRALSMFEQYFAGPGYEATRPPLKAEAIGSSEVVWEQGLGKHYTFSASGFYDRMQNLVDEVVDPATELMTFANVANVRARGLEFEVAGKHSSGLEGRASYSVQDAVNQETGRLLTNCPKHLGKVNVVVPLVREKLFAGIEGQYVSRRGTLAGSSVGSYPLVNLTLFNTRLFPRVDLSASLYNVFDKRYDDPAGDETLQNVLQQDGRSFRLKLSWRWGER